MVHKAHKGPPPVQDNYLVWLIHCQIYQDYLVVQRGEILVGQYGILLNPGLSQWLLRVVQLRIIVALKWLIIVAMIQLRGEEVQLDLECFKLFKDQGASDLVVVINSERHYLDDVVLFSLHSLSEGGVYHEIEDLLFVWRVLVCIFRIRA